MASESPTSERWYDGITRYQWIVLAIASAGWIFDVYEGQIFNITRSDMLADILGTSSNSPEVKQYGDMFLGILTTSYGSGKDGDKPSITHQELREVLKRDIPRWFLAHRDVELVYDLVRNLGYKIPDSISDLNTMMKNLHKQGRNPVIEDFRVLEIT